MNSLDLYCLLLLSKVSHDESLILIGHHHTYQKHPIFVHFLQQEFNNRNLNVVITSNTLSIDDFTVMGEVIMVSNNCCFNLDLLPIDVSKILYDSNLIGNFLQHLENEKLETLEIKKKVVPKLYKK